MSKEDFVTFLTVKNSIAIEPLTEQGPSTSVISGFALGKSKNSLVKATAVWNSITVRKGETVWLKPETLESKYPTYEMDGVKFTVVPEDCVVLVQEKRKEYGVGADCGGCSCDRQ